MTHSGCSCCVGALTRRSVLAIFAASGVATLAGRSNAAPLQTEDLAGWLRQRPRIQLALVWFAPGTADIVRYQNWPDEWRSELETAFALASKDQPTGLVDPPINSAPTTDPASNDTRLTEPDARRLYMALVAQSLAVELGRRVPWSIEATPDDQLAALLSGDSLFEFHAKSKLYRLRLSVVPAPPDVAYRFITKEQILAPTRRETIERLLQWCSERLVHFVGDVSVANLERSWQYRGWPPVSRVIAGTVYVDRNGPQPRQHITMGCWGTTGFLSSILRTVNIPVAQQEVFDQRLKNQVGRHSTAHFLSEDLFLSHSDDPYSSYIRLKPSFSSAKLLFGRQTFKKWFESGPAENVGRRVYELAFAEPSIFPVSEYVEDIKAGTPKTGKLLKTFARYYAPAELEQLGFWERLDDRVAQFGGPDGVVRQLALSKAAYNKGLLL